MRSRFHILLGALAAFLVAGQVCAADTFAEISVTIGGERDKFVSDVVVGYILTDACLAGSEPSSKYQISEHWAEVDAAIDDVLKKHEAKEVYYYLTPEHEEAAFELYATNHGLKPDVMRNTLASCKGDLVNFISSRAKIEFAWEKVVYMRFRSKIKAKDAALERELSLLRPRYLKHIRQSRSLISIKTTDTPPEGRARRLLLTNTPGKNTDPVSKSGVRKVTGSENADDRKPQSAENDILISDVEKSLSDLKKSVGGADKAAADLQALIDVVSLSNALKTKDYVRAREFAKKACDGGHAISCQNLGVMYHKGLGGAIDHEAAADYFEKACDLGYEKVCSQINALKQSDKSKMQGRSTHTKVSPRHLPAEGLSDLERRLPYYPSAGVFVPLAFIGIDSNKSIEQGKLFAGPDSVTIKLGKEHEFEGHIDSEGAELFDHNLGLVDSKPISPVIQYIFLRTHADEIESFNWLNKNQSRGEIIAINGDKAIISFNVDSGTLEGIVVFLTSAGSQFSWTFRTEGAAMPPSSITDSEALDIKISHVLSGATIKEVSPSGEDPNKTLLWAILETSGLGAGIQCSRILATVEDAYSKKFGSKQLHDRKWNSVVAARWRVFIKALDKQIKKSLTIDKLSRQISEDEKILSELKKQGSVSLIKTAEENISRQRAKLNELSDWMLKGKGCASKNMKIYSLKSIRLVSRFL